MKILITGATGHTGSRLARTLLQQGHVVVALTRSAEKLPADIRPNIEILRADLLTDAPGDVADRLAQTVGAVDAAIAMTHIKFAEHIAPILYSAKIRRVIFTSSTRRFTNYPEETARQVIAGEDFIARSQLDYTIIRPSMIYGGPEDNNIEHLVRRLRTWPVFPLPGGGRMLWQPVFTHDVIAAIVAALGTEAAIRNAFTVAGPEPISLRDMCRTILAQLPRRVPLIPVPLAPVRIVAAALEAISARPIIRTDQIRRLQEDKVFDISAARETLGFLPVSFEEGIRRKLAGTA